MTAKLRQILKDLPLMAISGFSSVEDVLKLMKVNRRHAAGVLIGGNFAGLFTDADFLERVVHCRKNPATTQVYSVMTPDPLTAPPDLEAHAAFDLMAGSGFGHIPVVCQQGTFYGIVSSADLRAAVNESLRSATRERDYLRHFVSGGYGLGPA